MHFNIKKKMLEYSTLGIMSGTSLDGIDLLHASIFYEKDVWTYKIHRAETFPYTEKWKKSLVNADKLSALEFINLHNQYGVLIGSIVNSFLKKSSSKIDFIASHGHTIFHEPNRKITFQIGNGASIAATTGLTTISDFRSLDVALGGQGAPLVPIGDELLFGDYHFCINLGGFANLSYTENGKRIAYDICPINIIANEIVKPLGLEFDESGNIGKKGKVNKGLLTELNNLDYYQQKAPKSLGREWVEAFFMPKVEKYNLNIEDRLRTIYEHVAIQIAKSVSVKEGISFKKKVLFTGGGAYNTFVMQRVKELIPHQIIIPDKLLIEFKEALIFSLLGVLTSRTENNCLSSVTGANRNNIGGIIHY